MLDQITPIVLTYNEAANIRRTLDAVSWAREIVLVDSHSDDATLTIVSQIPQVRVFQRRFDSLENQWNYALKQIRHSVRMGARLDADYVLTPESVEEMRSVSSHGAASAASGRSFVYCVRANAYVALRILLSLCCIRHKRRHLPSRRSRPPSSCRRGSSGPTLAYSPR